MVEARYQQAMTLFDAGRAYDCLEACEAILQDAPDHARTLHLTGVLCYAAKDLDAAAAYFRRAVEADPGLAEAHFNLALMLKKQGRVAEALEHYQLGLALDDNDPQAQFNLGLALWQEKRAAEAVTPLRRAIEIHPLLADGHNTLGLVELELGHKEEAEQAFRCAIAVEPRAAAPFQNLAVLLVQQGRRDEAIGLLQWAITMQGPFLLGPSLASLLEEAGRPQEAARVLAACDIGGTEPPAPPSTTP